MTIKIKFSSGKEIELTKEEVEELIDMYTPTLPPVMRTASPQQYQPPYVVTCGQMPPNVIAPVASWDGSTTGYM